MAKGNSGVLGTVSMIVAFVVMAGFMYWLSVASEPTEFAVAEEAGEQPQSVSMVAFSSNPAGYEGILVEMDGIQVQEILGTRAFLFALQDGSPYLVRTPVTAAAPEPGASVHMVGRVAPLDATLLATWAQEGLLADSASRATVESFTSYFEADEVHVMAGADAPVDTTAAASPPAGQD